MGKGNFKTCSKCERERQTTTGMRRVLVQHNRWDEKKGKMVPCEGSGKPPAARTVASSR